MRDRQLGLESISLGMDLLITSAKAFKVSNNLSPSSDIYDYAFIESSRDFQLLCMCLFAQGVQISHF